MRTLEMDQKDRCEDVDHELHRREIIIVDDHPIERLVGRLTLCRFHGPRCLQRPRSHGGHYKRRSRCKPPEGLARSVQFSHISGRKLDIGRGQVLLLMPRVLRHRNGDHTRLCKQPSKRNLVRRRRVYA